MAICCRISKLCTLAALILGIVFWVKCTYFTAPPPLPDISDAWWGKGIRAFAEDTSINQFEVRFSQKVIEDLYAKLAKTKYIEPLEDVDFKYGFHPDVLRKVINYWAEKYDMNETQSELNRYNHFLTKIEGLDIHFMHVKPKETYKNVRPLLLIHGWPGSFYEFYKAIPLLTDPLAHGGKADDPVFEVICPSIPGYGFSEAPHKKGFSAMYAAQMFTKLMTRLGHDTYYVQGGDWGAIIASDMATLFPQR